MWSMWTERASRAADHRPYCQSDFFLEASGNFGGIVIVVPQALQAYTVLNSPLWMISMCPSQSRQGR
jgi:hypothetical protein